MEHTRNFVVRGLGWPDEMHAREAIIEACHRLGSKDAFCQAVGISRRYLRLIMEWKRSPAHPRLLAYFGWERIYMTEEDFEEWFKTKRTRLQQ